LFLRDILSILDYMVLQNNKVFRAGVLFLSILLICSGSVSFSQPKITPRTLSVTASQPIHFGTFSVTGSSGGTVTVAYDGTRTSSGDIMLLPVAPFPQPAIFEVQLCDAINLSISFGGSVTLTGSEGGSITLEIGPTEQGASGAVFPATCDFATLLRVGGTLNIPPETIPGNYSGTFEITFIQE
jgi:hypothetical protein